MSVVDQRAELVTGVLRRLLLRVALVLGGVFAVTAIGWLLGAGSAHADLLPSVPSLPTVPSVLSSVTSDVPAVTPKKIDNLATSALPVVGKQAHRAVTTIRDRITPSVTGTDLVPTKELVPLAKRLVATGTRHETKHAAVPAPSAHPADQVSPAASRRPSTIAGPTGQPSNSYVLNSHVSDHVTDSHPATSAESLPHTGTTPSPADSDHHSPHLPPLQPASSSDSSAHGEGGVAGGAGDVGSPFTNLIGDDLTTVDTPSIPRLAAGPGRQPGTSPD